MGRPHGRLLGLCRTGYKTESIKQYSERFCQE